MKKGKLKITVYSIYLILLSTTPGILFARVVTSGNTNSGNSRYSDYNQVPSESFQNTTSSVALNNTRNYTSYTKESGGTYTARVTGTLSARADSWIDFNKNGEFASYGRISRSAGTFSVDVTGLSCGKSYLYRTGAINPYTGEISNGQTYSLNVVCDYSLSDGSCISDEGRDPKSTKLSCIKTSGQTSCAESGYNYECLLGGWVARKVNDTAEPKLLISTGNVSDVTTNQAKVYGNIDGALNGWVEVNSNRFPQLNYNETTMSGPLVILYDLNCGTRYQYRAAGMTHSGTVLYGETKSFTTQNCLDSDNQITNTDFATVNTLKVQNISTSGARVYGYAVGVLKSWIEINLGQKKGGVVKIGETNSTGPLSVLVTNLDCNTTYYYRAAGKTNTTTLYGNNENFLTSPCISTRVVTRSVLFSTSQTKKIVEGEILGDKNVYSAIEVNLGNGASEIGGRNRAPGKFSVQIKNLKCGLTYYYRAIVTNEEDQKIYGDIKNFTMPDCSNNRFGLF